MIGGIVFAVYADRYYRKLKGRPSIQGESSDLLSQFIKDEVYMLPEDATVRDVIAYFSDKHISGAPIVSATGKAVGFISDGDIMRYLREDDHLPYAIDSSESFMDFWNPGTEFEEKMNFVMNLYAREIGSKKPITISASASLENVCNLLSETGIKKVPVVDADKVVGTITRSAITHYLARRYLERTQKGVSD